ncbi:MAG TPA: histidine phosphatase family protein [Candidatus Dormibacteraeota bacterium]
MRHTGRTDVPLLPEGEANAVKLGERLRGISFTAAYTSPLQRARRTAALAGFPKAEVTDLLLEYDYGDYEGLTYAQIVAQRPGWDLFRDGCPGGETPAQVYARAMRFVELATEQYGPVIAFAHGHILRAVTVAFLGWQVELASPFANLDTGALGLLVDGQRGRVLTAWNRN